MKEGHRIYIYIYIHIYIYIYIYIYIDLWEVISGIFIEQILSQ